MFNTMLISFNATGILPGGVVGYVEKLECVTFNKGAIGNENGLKY